MTLEKRLKCANVTQIAKRITEDAFRSGYVYEFVLEDDGDVIAVLDSQAEFGPVSGEAVWPIAVLPLSMRPNSPMTSGGVWTTRRLLLSMAQHMICGFISFGAARKMITTGAQKLLAAILILSMPTNFSAPAGIAGYRPLRVDSQPGADETSTTAIRARYWSKSVECLPEALAVPRWWPMATF